MLDCVMEYRVSKDVDNKGNDKLCQIESFVAGTLGLDRHELL